MNTISDFLYEILDLLLNRFILQLLGRLVVPTRLGSGWL